MNTWNSSTFTVGGLLWFQEQNVPAVVKHLAETDKQQICTNMFKTFFCFAQIKMMGVIHRNLALEIEISSWSLPPFLDMELSEKCFAFIAALECLQDLTSLMSAMDDAELDITLNWIYFVGD